MQKSSHQFQRILFAESLLKSLSEIKTSSVCRDVEFVMAKTHSEALNLASEDEFSLILIDAQATCCNPWELASAIHRSPASKFTPILFVSNQTLCEHTLNRCYESGSVDVLYAHLSPQVIQAKIEIFLELDKQRRLIKQQSNVMHATLTKLQHYARHDQLTQLFNREQVTNIIVRLMADSRRHHKRIALLFIDLDHFKHVNDSLGHDMGDMLLKSVADRLKSVVRESDFVARLGGDEFAVVLNDISRAGDAGEVAQKILEKVVAAHRIARHEVLVSCSIGIAVYDNGPKSANDLIKSADCAMYLAKKKGRNQYAYFSPELERQASRKIKIAQDLENAIKNNELSIAYQHLEKVILAKEQRDIKLHLANKWLANLLAGEFFSEGRQSHEEAIQFLSKELNGMVELVIDKGRIEPVSVTVPRLTALGVTRPNVERLA